MEDITGFSMKDCLFLPCLGWKYFDSLKTEEDEPIYTYNDKYMRWFVRQSVKRGRVCAFNQYYKSKICDDISKIISEELDVKENVYYFLEVYLKYKNKHLKSSEIEYESKFNDYRNENIEEKEKYIYEKLCQLLIHQFTKQKKLGELLWDFDAVSLYPSAMWDKNGIYPRIETGYAITEDMNNELVDKFNTGNFTKGSAILRRNFYNLKNFFVQHLPLKEREKKFEINCTRNGYIIDTLTSVDIQEIVKIRGE